MQIIVVYPFSSPAYVLLTVKASSTSNVNCVNHKVLPDIALPSFCHLTVHEHVQSISHYKSVKVTIPVKINGIGTNTDANISGTLKFMHVRYLYSVPHSFCFCLFFSIFSSLIYFFYHYPFHQHFLLLLVFLLLELFQRLVLHF